MDRLEEIGIKVLVVAGGLVVVTFCAVLITIFVMTIISLVTA